MKVISQETFDSVVLEGVKDFENPLDVAIDDAIKEFEAQGVNLGNIVTNMKLSEDKESIIHDVVTSIKLIYKHNEDNLGDLEEVKEALKLFTKECQTSLAHRMLANDHAAYSVLIKFLQQNENGSSEMLELSLKAITALTILNSDILEAQGATLMITLLDNWQNKSDESNVPECLALWCIESSLKHEMNRQNLMRNRIQPRLIGLMKGHSDNPSVVKACSKALRCLMLDDDIRQDFSKAHDHARELVEEHDGITVCLDMVKSLLRSDAPAEVVFELLATLSRQCVRAEYCQQVVDKEGLVIINEILVSFPNFASLNKQAINLLKTISGNDKVKEEAVRSGAPSRIVAALDKHQSHPGLCEAGCAAIAMLALRVPANAKMIVEIGGGQAVTQAMKIHPKNPQVQKFGCMAIRNLVTRIPENKAVLLECEAEDAIKEALQNHGNVVKDHAMAALRDLDINVELIEQWRGTGHEISR